MATTRDVVVGVFNDAERARDAISALKDAGFAGTDISVLMPDRGQARDFAEDTGTETGTGAATGLVAGGILGGLGGWLVGIGALAIPGVGPFIAAGALGTALAGAAIGAGVGVIAGALIGMGIPEEEAGWYENEVKGGRTLVTVRAGARDDVAEDILHDYGAYDVNHRDAGSYTPRSTWSRGAMDTASAAGTAGTAGMTTRPSGMPSTSGDRTVELREEQLRADKQRVQAGEVEVGKRVVSEQRTLDVPVTREEVVIERRPVDRAATDADFADTEDETIRVPVMEENVEVEKHPVVTSEVTVGKRVTQDTQRVSGTVRREELDVEHRGDVDVAGAAAETWDAVMPRYRADWQGRHGAGGGAGWAEYEPRYRYGWEMGNRPEYRGRTWATVEPDLRRDYEQRYGASTWDQVKDSVHDAWDSVTGQRTSRY